MRCYTLIFLSGFLLQSPLSLVQRIQELTLKQGYLLWYLYFSIDAQGINPDNAYLDYYDKSQTLLARKLLSLMCSGHRANRDVMLSIIPPQLQGAIDDAPEGTVRIAGVKASEKDKVTTALWYQFQSGVVTRVNCEHLFNNLDEDIKLPHVVWVGRMKAELLDALRQEIENLHITRDIHPGATWDADAFDASHSPYLDKYCRVGNFFVSILIPALQNRASGYVLRPELMQQLLSALFQRAVIEDDPAWKLACMGAISTMYERYPEQFRELLIIPYYVYLLHPARAEPIWRDHIIRFMQTVLREPINAKRFLTFGGLTPLIYLINIIHTLDAPADVRVIVEGEGGGEGVGGGVGVGGEGDLPDLDRRQSLSIRMGGSLVERVEGKDPIDEGEGEDENGGNGRAGMDSDDSDAEGEGQRGRGAVPRSKGAKGEMSYSPSPSPTNPQLMSSSSDEEVMSPPAAPPAPGPPPPPPPPPQPTRNGPARPTPSPPAGPAPPAQSSPPSSSSAPAASKAPTGGLGLSRGKSIPSPAAAAAATAAQVGGKARNTVSSPSSTNSSPSTVGPTSGPLLLTPPHSSPNPPTTTPTPTTEAKPIMVTQAGGTRMKSAAESKWDWSDEKENLMSGLPPIFSVEEVAARCIRLLRIIAYGGAKLRRQLTTPPLLQCLSTLLLCPVNETREDGLRLYLDLLSTSPHVIPFLVTTGLFPLLLYSTRFGFSPLLAKLIDRTHTRQTPEHVPEGTSALAPYLPAPLIAVLQSESAEGLRLAMDTDTVQPDMIWNATLRLHLHDSIARLLAPFLTLLRKQPDAPFPAQLLKGGIVYDALDDELCIGGVYVRPLNEIGETDLQAVHLKDPARFVTELMRALNAKRYSGDELGAVLLSTTIVVSRHGGVG